MKKNHIFCIILLKIAILCNCRYPQKPVEIPDEKNPPAVPANVIIGEATINSLTITWDSVDNAAGYNIYRSQNQDGVYNSIGGNIAAPGYTDTELAPDSPYWYRVTAYNAFGESRMSIAAKGITLKQPATTCKVSFNIYDQDTGIPLINSRLGVLEMNFDEILPSNTHELALSEGLYNIYLAKSGYRARGYVIYLNNDITIKAGLKNLETCTFEYENISGIIKENGNPYTGNFFINRGLPGVCDITEITEGTGSFSVNSQCGMITVSAFTKPNNRIDKIEYIAHQFLARMAPLNDLVLNFTDTAPGYSGTLPSGGDLKVKLDSGYILAVQDVVPDNNYYSLHINPAPGDSIILESARYDGADTYFTRKDAGSAGGSNNLVYELDPPAISVEDNTDYYMIAFDSPANASFFESYVLEVSRDMPCILFYTVCLTGNHLKIPKTVLSSGTGEFTVFLSAVKLSDYDATALLENSLSCNQYSFSETGISLNRSGAISSNRSNDAVINYRKEHHFNYLLLEE